MRNQEYIPICSMYGICTYIWLICLVNVGKYNIHGADGYKYIIIHIYTYMHGEMFRWHFVATATVVSSRSGC